MHCCNALRKNTYFESFILDIYAVDKLKNLCFFLVGLKHVSYLILPPKKYFKKYKQTKLAKKYIYSFYDQGLVNTRNLHVSKYELQCLKNVHWIRLIKTVVL